MEPTMEVQKELMSIPEFGGEDDAICSRTKVNRQFEKAILMVSGAAVQKFMMNIEQEQEVLMNIADMAISFSCWKCFAALYEN